MHKKRGVNQGHSILKGDKRARMGIGIFLIFLELITILMTLWFTAPTGEKVGNGDNTVVAASARSAQPDRTAAQEKYDSRVLIYCAGVETVTAVMFAASVIFKNRFFYEKAIRKEKERLNIRLAKAEEAASQANVAKSRFLSGMSHEIRTPINAIMGTTRLAIMNLDSEERVKHCLQTIDRASGHLLLLVNDVLDISRIESGKAVLKTNPFNITEILNNCVLMTKGQLQNRIIDFSVRFDDFSCYELIGDGLHLSQILINLLANAVKYTPDGGKVIFRAREEKQSGAKISFVFRIEDTGIGMSAEFMEHIWEPFAREEKGTPVNQGTGLGLAIVKKYVDLMGGHIDVESHPGKGSIFTVRLLFDRNRDAIEDEKEDDTAKLDGMKVLLVEDNLLNKEVAKTLLETQGVDVDAADNGQMALDMFMESSSFGYDAILMDVMMPVMDGITATRRIRSLGREDSGTIPIIAMTANAFDEDVKLAKEAGMNEHVSKPIDFYRLFGILRKYRRI